MRIINQDVKVYGKKLKNKIVHDVQPKENPISYFVDDQGFNFSITGVVHHDGATHTVSKSDSQDYWFVTDTMIKL